MTCILTRHIFQLCLLAYKVFNNVAMPVCISSLYSKVNHGHNTRVINYNFCLSCSRTNIRRYSGIVNSIVFWNSLPVDARQCNSISIFKNWFKHDVFRLYL
jgi:hypothetical protein